MLVRARPDGRVPAGHDRPRGRQGRAAGDDRPLRADGRPGRHPRRAARPERPAGQGVAGRQGRLRLEVRDALLAVDQGHRPAARARRAFVPPSGHMAGIWARNDDTRGVHKAPANEVDPRRDLRSSSTSPRASTTSSTRSASTASGRSPAGASASGAPGRCRATRRGATSTSAGCSTTSRSRSSRAPSGSSSSRTTCDLWGSRQAHRQRVPARASGATARCSGRTPGRGVLRQVRRGEQPARGPRRRAARSSRSASRRSSRPSSWCSGSPVLRRRRTQRIGRTRHMPDRAATKLPHDADYRSHLFCHRDRTPSRSTARFVAKFSRSRRLERGR